MLKAVPWPNLTVQPFAKKLFLISLFSTKTFSTQISVQSKSCCTLQPSFPPESPVSLYYSMLYVFNMQVPPALHHSHLQGFITSLSILLWINAKYIFSLYLSQPSSVPRPPQGFFHPDGQEQCYFNNLCYFQIVPDGWNLQDPRLTLNLFNMSFTLSLTV